MNDITSQFKFPEAALKAGAANFLAKGYIQKSIGSNGTINDYQMAGHDRGVAYRFFVHPVKNEMKSEECDMEINDEVDMIEWKVSKSHMPVERVHMIGDALLKFAKEPKYTAEGKRYMVVRRPLECTGGILGDAYRAWKEGYQAPGLQLHRWDRLSVGQVATLNSLGVYSVQQFASMPRDRVVGRMPSELQAAFEDAIQFVNAQRPMVDLSAYADQILNLKQESSKKDDAIRLLQEQMTELLAKQNQPKKKGMPKGGWPSMKKNKEINQDGDQVQS